MARFRRKEIAKVDGAWGVTPGGNATAVTITGLAEGVTVAGVKLGDCVVPSAAVTVKAIPGLKYELRRAETLPAPHSEGAAGTVWGVVGEPVAADGTTVTLEDGDPPANKAFYRVVVSMYFREL